MSHEFLLGLASGVALLPIAAYRRASPPWLRWLLIGTGVLVVARYATIAQLTHAPEPSRIASYVLLVSPVGFALPTTFAVDRLVQHPALSAGKLLRWSAPPLAVYLAVALLAEVTSGPWLTLLSVFHAAFVLGFIGLCLTLARKLPDRRLRSSLAVLALSYASMAATGLLGLLPELLILLALWAAYETS